LLIVKPPPLLLLLLLHAKDGNSLVVGPSSLLFISKYWVFWQGYADNGYTADTNRNGNTELLLFPPLSMEDYVCGVAEVQGIYRGASLFFSLP